MTRGSCECSASIAMSLNLGKVLISDSVDASCREILQNSGISVDYKPGISKEELLSIIKVLYYNLL